MTYDEHPRANKPKDEQVQGQNFASLPQIGIGGNRRLGGRTGFGMNTVR